LSNGYVVMSQTLMKSTIASSLCWWVLSDTLPCTLFLFLFLSFCGGLSNIHSLIQWACTWFLGFTMLTKVIRNCKIFWTCHLMRECEFCRHQILAWFMHMESYQTHTRK
jgi:hypothetical protein